MDTASISRYILSKEYHYHTIHYVDVISTISKGRLQAVCLG
jgi:hypothetical protein